MIKKFELDLSSKITMFGIELFRSKAFIQFGNVKKAYQDSKDSGKHYEAYVNLVKTLEQEE